MVNCYKTTLYSAINSSVRKYCTVAIISMVALYDLTPHKLQRYRHALHHTDKQHIKTALHCSNTLNYICKLAFSFFLQHHWFVYQNIGQGDLSRYESLQCGVCDRISWILWRLVYGSESFGQTRYVPVRFFFLFEVIR